MLSVVTRDLYVVPYWPHTGLGEILEKMIQILVVPFPVM
jgi:hypothetical protein